MKFLDFLILLLLFTIIGLGVYVIWFNLPIGPGGYNTFSINTSKSESNSIQFYPNMRYVDKTINYYISNSCDFERMKNAQEAFLVIGDKTVLTFTKVGNPSDAQIRVLCSNIAPTPEEEGHFVAGEGGPSEIINSSRYAIILSGKVSLFRLTNCDSPNVAIHEILHALGFDHNGNEKSIMYPITGCDQEIDIYIINEIDRLYRADSLPDLVIEKGAANKTGRYLSFDITIANFGLKDSTDSDLSIYAGGELVKDFNLGEINIGTRKVLSVENLRVPRDSGDILFQVRTEDRELDDSNNEVKILLG